MHLLTNWKQDVCYTLDIAADDPMKANESVKASARPLTRSCRSMNGQVDSGTIYAGTTSFLSTLPLIIIGRNGK